MVPVWCGRGLQTKVVNTLNTFFISDESCFRTVGSFIISLNTNPKTHHIIILDHSRTTNPEPSQWATLYRETHSQLELHTWLKVQTTLRPGQCNVGSRCSPVSTVRSFKLMKPLLVLSVKDFLSFLSVPLYSLMIRWSSLVVLALLPITFMSAGIFI